MSKPDETHYGRPLYSRIQRGYRDDIAALQRLRKACLTDKRISTRLYTRISHKIQEIVGLLAPFAQPGKAGRGRAARQGKAR